jgi:protein O-GlcNAc transferase
MADPLSEINRVLASGDYTGAKEILERRLKTSPSDINALYFLGVVEQASNSWDAALSLFDRVLALDPLHALAHYNKALLLMSLDKHDEALKHHALAVQLNPRNFWARLNRGNSFVALKEFHKAIDEFQSVISMAPNFPEAWVNKGNVLRELKRPEEALASYEHAVNLKPGYAEAWSNRGNALLDLRRPEEALASYERALTLKPDYPEALNNRGNALRILNQPEYALLSYNCALALKPDYPEALNNRGNALMDLKQPDEALLSYDRAIALKRDDYAEARYNLGSALRELGRHEDAAKIFAGVVEVSPDFDYALGDMFHSQLLCCNWTQFAQNAERIVQAVTGGKKASAPLPFVVVSHSAEAQLRCARTYIGDKYPLSSSPLWAGQRYQHDRIRVAYLSGDFREHAVSFLLAGLFEKHDRERFETIAISLRPEDKSIAGQRVKSAFGRFVEVTRKSDRQVANLLREIETDIAVDLMGFTLNSRTTIFAHRCAPIQVNYLGFPATMGAEYFDYIIADDFVIPREKQNCYSERAVYLPDSFQANDDRRRINEKIPTRLEAGLPEFGFVFCSFNNSYKISPAIFDVWTRLLKAVAGSVLWLVADNVTVENNLRREAANRSIEPRRLIFAPRLQYADHLARFQLADLFLDTVPFNAGTTASDALWTGVPALTCAGEAFASRMAGSLLNAIGLPELITYNLEDYEALAHKLAIQPAMLNEIRARLAKNRGIHPLFNTDRFRRHIEAAYTAMWERYQRGEPPESFAVEPING